MITPVLLAGGAGTRLWPVSRHSYPKQFTRLVGDDSLFQATARRFAAPGFAAPVVLTHADFRFLVRQQLDDIGLTPQAVMIEPEARNTAPAVLAAALWVASRDPAGLVLIAPSDHVIAQPGLFRAAVQAGVEPAQAGRIVTFGIRPDRPETGYGYLHCASPAQPGRPVALTRFVEKPDAAQAAAMIADGRHLWNAGIFLFRADAMIDAFARHAPDFLTPVAAALDQARNDLDFLRLASEPWAGLPDLSIDYAVMERADNLTVVPYPDLWTDLGGWEALWREGAPSPDATVTRGAATAIDCNASLLMSEASGIELVGIGLTDMIAVATPDAVLVAPRARAQDVRQAVAALAAKGAPQARRHRIDHRPWGWFETLALDDRFQVKRIHVNPGAALSLQSHVHRAEHWIVVTGTARVTVAGKVMDLGENQSVYVPLGAIHRLENPGTRPMVLIEVQTGAYLGEDDIIRYDDAYHRDLSEGTAR
ncbi:mannose-1-phosphate guanylyltransferase/mannose-6-phosphate isomerase [Paracoccus sp. p4-l81]|uniref:mannose-1-phosphate guanylyltransferase/mannose-6-phosphate isomerase n=1 Tax=Paracoccus sp. p4-l81 TaxID=3342806 RepID=UPI0035BB62B3